MSEKKVEYILGIDPGYGRVGYGIIKKEKGEYLYVNHGCIETFINQTFLERLEMIHNELNKIIKKYRIDVVGFIPPTVKREVQFIHVLQRQLQIKKDILSIEKIINDVAVPQKSLTKKEDRIENAKQTIYVTDKRKFTNILLIDDAVGSGATLNETAKKIRKQKLNGKYRKPVNVVEIFNPVFGFFVHNSIINVVNIKIIIIKTE